MSDDEEFYRPYRLPAHDTEGLLEWGALGLLLQSGKWQRSVGTITLIEKVWSS